MKFAKLGFKTKEGISLAHFQDGWGMEYGEGGSYCVDILLNGKKVAQAMEYGNGGPINIYGLDKSNEKDLSTAVIAFLKRTNEDYGPNSQYDFCRNVTKAGDCEYSSMINDLLDIYDYRKKAKNYIKKGYNLVLVAQNDYATHVAASQNPSREHLLEYAKRQKLVGDKTNVIYITPTDDLNEDI